MANIRIDVIGELVDGQNVTFRAPCDCTSVTGLKVYYIKNGEKVSKVFTMKDAHGNSLANLNNLFAEGAYVHAILDINNNYAYMQNVDTNGYLESRLNPVDNLTSTSATVPLSANQGRVLKNLVDSKKSEITTTVSSGKSATAADSTITQIASVSLTKGTYLVLGSAYITGWDITKSGERKICISTSATSFNNTAGGNALATEDMATSVNCWAFLTLTATTTVYLLGYQASGLSQTISNGNLCALKLA